MNTDNNKKDKRFSKLLSTIEKGKVLPDKQFLAQLREKSVEEFETYSTESKDHSQAEIISIWRIIMKSRITKIAAAAVIIIAILHCKSKQKQTARRPGRSRKGGKASTPGPC